MKSARALSLALLLFFCVAGIVGATTYTTWDSSQTYPIENNGIGGTYVTVLRKTATSTALINPFDTIDRTLGVYKRARVYVSGTGWFNGTVATPTWGIPCANTWMDFNLPANPAEAGISFIATSTTAPTLYILPLFE